MRYDVMTDMAIISECGETNFHNALLRVIQFVFTHRRSYTNTSFEKEQSIA